MNLAAPCTSACKPIAIQVCRFSSQLESGLAERLELLPLPEEPATQWPDSFFQMAAQAEIVLTSGKHGCDASILSRLANVRLVAIHGVGYDRVDLELAARRGVVVATTPGVLDDDVADLAVGLIISLLRQLPQADRHVRGGYWPAGDLPLGRKVSGRRFGIVGLGRIGTAIANRLTAFGPIAYTGKRPKEVPWQWHADVRSLAEASDVLVISCAANPATVGLIDAEVLRRLGADGVLVNVARGSVVNQSALTDALEQGTICGAALDVFENEPDIPLPLRTSARTMLAPHIGSATVEARHAMAEAMLANVDAFIAGNQPPGIVGSTLSGIHTEPL